MRSYKLKNLNCANCAINIETALKKMDIVKDVSISFATETLKIDTSDFDSVKRKIKDIEPDVEIEDSIKSTSKDSFLKIKRELIPLIIYFLLFIVGLIFEKQLHNNFYQIFEYILFLSIYLLAGWKVLFTVLRNIFKGKIFDENFLMTIATLGAILIHALPEAAGVMLFYKLIVKLKIGLFCSASEFQFFHQFCYHFTQK